MQKSQPLPAGKRSENKAVLVLLGLTGAGKKGCIYCIVKSVIFNGVIGFKVKLPL